MTKMLDFGGYKIATIETGTFRLDGGAMFGVVPFPLWSKLHIPDERQRVRLAARVMLLQGHGKIILVDVGNGNKYSEKLLDIYNIEHKTGELERGLLEYGIRPENVTDVILTHFHFDHAGGCTKMSGGRPVPVFPHAKYYIQKEHSRWSENPTEKDRASFFEADYVPLREAGSLIEISGDIELLPSIFVKRTYGHTIALQTITIKSDGADLLYVSDLIPTSVHLPLPYIMAYDLQPLQTLKEKREVLERVASEGSYIVFEHDPIVVASTVERTDRGIKLGRSFRSLGEIS